LNYLLLFFVPFIAGSLVFFFQKDQITRYTEYIRLFGASFFLGVIVMHLLPEVFHHADRVIGLFVAFGFFFQVLVEAFTGSEPHDHVLPRETSHYSIGLLIGLGIHAFFEGFPLAGSYAHMHHGHAHMEHTYLLGVLLHKIPVVIVLALMMLTTGLSRRSIIIQLIVFSLMTPLGLFTGEFVPAGSIWSQYILAFVVGSISHIAMHLIVSRDIGAGGKGAVVLKVGLMVLGFAVVYLVG
jgi:zinc transporter ZupT